MMDWRLKFASWKQRYDISASFLGLVNFILLSITASQPISDFLITRLGIRIDQFLIVGLLCGMLVVGFLLFGLFLEKVFHYWSNLMTIQNNKNPQIQELLDNTREILRRSENVKSDTKR